METCKATIARAVLGDFSQGICCVCRVELGTTSFMESALHSLSASRNRSLMFLRPFKSAHHIEFLSICSLFLLYYIRSDPILSHYIELNVQQTRILRYISSYSKVISLAQNSLCRAFPDISTLPIISISCLTRIWARPS